MKTMSDFVISVGIESHARLVSEWGYFKNQAKVGAEDLEQVTTMYDGLRRGLCQVLGVEFDGQRTDAELMILLAAELEKQQVRPVDRVEYAAGGLVGAPDAVVDLSALHRARPGYQSPSEDRAVPPITLEVNRQVAWVPPAWSPPADADASGQTEQRDGSPTESMPPVAEPPQPPAGYTIGRVFHRGDALPDDVHTYINRMGDWWTVEAPEFVESDTEPRAQAREWRDHLHMHGTLWELVYVGEQADAPEEQPPPRPDLHVATLYTSQQDGGSRWYELSDGWVVCARTLEEAQRGYPTGAVRLDRLRETGKDLRDEGIATS